MARALAPAPLRLPRPVARVDGTARAGARGASAGGRIVSCHLGAGASLCAIADGRSIDTTMGFTPLEGLVMATRSGSVDPGLVLWLAERMPHEELADGLEQRSGLVGLAGSADMREVLERAETGEPGAQLALDVYCHRLKLEIAAMVGALGGIDVLAFTGGIGEHAAPIRARAARDLAISVCTSTRRPTTPRTPMPTSARSERPCRPSWSLRERTSRSRARRAPFSANDHAVAQREHLVELVETGVAMRDD